MSTGPSRRSHPFGRAANWLVVGGVSLSLIQSVVVALAAFAAPLTEGFEVEGPRLLGWLVLGVGIPLAFAWLAVRALRRWWRRSITVLRPVAWVGAISIPATLLLMVPLGEETMIPIGYLPAGVMALTGAFLARPNVEAARREGRGGLSS